MTSENTDANSLGAARAHWPEILLGILLLAGCIPLRAVILGHDVVWQLWIGRQMIHGVRLYGQILEINPPLWFWIAEPLAGLAERLRVSEGSVLIGFFLAATLTCAALLATLVREETPLRRAVLFGGFVLVTLGLNLRDFGQREHFALIASIPYAALIARRAEGRRASWPLALATGLVGASAFALKPYFAGVPLLLEAWLFLAARRTGWRLLRVEVIALGIAAGGYAAAVLLLTPDYLTNIVPMVREAYAGQNAPILTVVRNIGLPLIGTSVLALLLLGNWPSKLCTAFLLSAGVFFAGYLLQAKGWRYQTLPGTGLLIMAVAAEAGRWHVRALRLRAQAGVLLLCLVLASVVVRAATYGYYPNVFRRPTTAALANLPTGATVMMLSAYASTLWPMVEERGLAWPSRHFSFWMLPAIAKADKGPRGQSLRLLADKVRTQTVEDLICNPPERILVDEETSHAWGVPFDYLAFFQASPEFSTFFARYRPGPRFGPVSTYDLADRSGLVRPVSCRRIY